MSDPNLEEIWRVRQKLIQQHGGIEGYVKHVQKLDRARRGAHRQKNKKAGKPELKPSK